MMSIAAVAIKPSSAKNNSIRLASKGMVSIIALEFMGEKIVNGYFKGIEWPYPLLLFPLPEIMVLRLVRWHSVCCSPLALGNSQIA